MVRVNVATGWLDEAQVMPTAHQDARPEGQGPELVVVHGISLPPGQFGSDDVQKLFLGQLKGNEHPFYWQLQGVRVSAHLFIRRDGSLVQFVPFHARAWHAGLSRLGSRSRCNDFSIGIELEGTDTCAYESVQYARLNEVLAALRAAYPALVNAPVVGHADIAPLRKTDPGLGFDWQALQVRP